MATQADDDASSTIASFLNAPAPGQQAQQLADAKLLKAQAQAVGAQQQAQAAGARNNLAQGQLANQAQQQQQQAQRNARAQGRARGRIVGQAIAAGKGTLGDNPVANKVEAVAERVGNFPTPGGLFALFVVLLLFVFLIVPVNGGLTRAQLFWLTLLGRTRLPQGAEPASGGDAGGTSGGSSSGGGGFASTPAGATGGGPTGVPLAPALPVLPKLY